jgi:Domain of unknown function (DUF3846)
MKAARVDFDSKTLVELPNNDYATLREVVEGSIEAMFTVQVRGNQYVTAYVNDEGLLIGLPKRAAVVADGFLRPFAGNMVVTGVNMKTGNTIAIPAEASAKVIVRAPTRMEAAVASFRMAIDLDCVIELK